MESKIRIRPANGTWVVRAGGAVLGETCAALSVSRGDAPIVIYFPRGDIAMDFLDEGGQGADDPVLGTARQFSIVTKSRTLQNAAWSYEAPADPELEAIRGHVAFDAADAVQVEKV